MRLFPFLYALEASSKYAARSSASFVAFLVIYINKQQSERDAMVEENENGEWRGGRESEKLMNEERV